MKGEKVPEDLIVDNKGPDKGCLEQRDQKDDQMAKAIK